MQQNTNNFINYLLIRKKYEYKVMLTFHQFETIFKKNIPEQGGTHSIAGKLYSDKQEFILVKDLGFSLGLNVTGKFLTGGGINKIQLEAKAGIGNWIFFLA